MQPAVSCSPAQRANSYEGVVPVRAFPISAPEEGVSLLGEDGHELRWINRLSDLPEETRLLIEAELAQREFMPEITRIRQVSSFATPSKWQVSTNRGDTELLLKAEDQIRRLDPHHAADHRWLWRIVPDPGYRRDGSSQPKAAGSIPVMTE